MNENVLSVEQLSAQTILIVLSSGYQLANKMVLQTQKTSPSDVSPVVQKTYLSLVENLITLLFCVDSIESRGGMFEHATNRKTFNTEIIKQKPKCSKFIGTIPKLAKKQKYNTLPND